MSPSTASSCRKYPATQNYPVGCHRHSSSPWPPMSDNASRSRRCRPPLMAGEDAGRVHIDQTDSRWCAIILRD